MARKGPQIKDRVSGVVFGDILADHLDRAGLRAAVLEHPESPQRGSPWR
jgi:hypothetical protein